MNILSEKQIIDVINDLNKKNMFLKDFNDREDKLKDIALIIKTLKEKKLLTDFPHIDNIHRVYYLYEEIIIQREKLPDIDVKQSCYNYFHNVSRDYHGTALTIDKKISYDDFKRNIEKDAIINREIGIKDSDRVTFLLPSMPDTYSNFYALSKIGAGRNIVDLRTSLEGIIKYINETSSEYLFCMETMSPSTLKEILNKTSIKKIRLFTPPLYSVNSKVKKNIGKCIILANEFGYKMIGENLFVPEYCNKLYLGNKNIVKESPYDSSKATLFMHTSGTSGFPKTIMSNDEAINIVANQYRKSLMDLKPGYRSLGIMPPWIFYGIMGFHMPFALNMNVYPIADPVKTKFDDIMLNIKPNTIAGVPNHWISLLNSDKIKDDFSLDFLKTPACGGDGISKTNNNKVNSFLKKHNSKMNLGAGYALSENTSVATANQDIYNKSGSVGINFIDMKCAIVDPITKVPLKNNQKGIVCVNGDIMLGYLNNQKETEKVFITIDDEKYVYTGDIGFVDEDGFLTIEGREKNLIVRNDGFKVSPLEIENIILKHSTVKNCVVFAIKDKKYTQGSLPAVRIEFKNDEMSELDKMIAIKEIKKLCEKNLSSYYQPVSYYIGKIPFTKMAKVDREQILNDYEKESISKHYVKKNKIIY